MTQQTTSGSTEANRVRKVMIVQARADVAWRVFTDNMGTWWPLATYKIGKANAVDVVMEPRVGGRWYERGDDGSTCDWGRVLAWEPHSRLVLSWEISADWQHDPTVKTEVEVRFSAEGASTRVDLEHRLLNYYGGRAAEMQGIFDSEQGWKGLLDAFAARASAG